MLYYVGDGPYLRSVAKSVLLGGMVLLAYGNCMLSVKPLFKKMTLIYFRDSVISHVTIQHS